MWSPDRKSTRLNSSHTVIYTLSLHDALPIYFRAQRKPPGSLDAWDLVMRALSHFWRVTREDNVVARSEEHTSELQSHSDLHSFPTRRSSDLFPRAAQAAGKP